MSRAAVNKIVRTMTRRHYQRERETMTPDEIDQRVIEAIVESMTARGTVSIDDIRRKNILPSMITAERFKRLLERAKEQHPEIEHIPTCA